MSSNNFIGIGGGGSSDGSSESSDGSDEEEPRRQQRTFDTDDTPFVERGGGSDSPGDAFDDATRTSRDADQETEATANDTPFVKRGGGGDSAGDASESADRNREVERNTSREGTLVSRSGDALGSGVGRDIGQSGTEDPSARAGRGASRRRSAFTPQDSPGRDANTTTDPEIEQSEVTSFIADIEDRYNIDVPGQGPLATERQTFRDIDFSFGFGGEGDEVEQAAGDLQARTQETFEPVGEALFPDADRVIGGFEHSSAIAIGLEQAGYDDLAEQADTTVRNVGKGIAVGTPTAVAGLPKTILEGTEVAVDTASNPEDAAEKIPAAAAEAVVSGGEGFLRNPGRATGGILGGAAVGAGFGRFAGTTRLGTGTSGRVIRAVDVDPGKSAVAAGRRVGRGTRRFLEDDRGQVQLTRGKGRSDGSEIDAEVDNDLMNREIASTNPEPPDVDRGETLEIMRKREIELTPQPRLNTGRRTGPTSRYRQELFPDRETPPTDDFRDVANLERVLDVDAEDLGQSGGRSASAAGAGLLADISAGDLTDATIPATFDDGEGLARDDEGTETTARDAASVLAGDFGGTILDQDIIAETRVTPDTTPDVTSDTTPDTDTRTTPDVTPDVTPDITPDVRTTPDVTPDVRTTPDTTPDITPDFTPDPRLTPDPDPDPEFRPDPDPDPDPDPELDPDLLVDDSKSRRRWESEMETDEEEFKNLVNLDALDAAADLAADVDDLFKGGEFR